MADVAEWKEYGQFPCTCNKLCPVLWVEMLPKQGPLPSQVVEPSTARNPIHSLEHVPLFEQEAKAALDRVVQATAVRRIPTSTGTREHLQLGHQEKLQSAR